MTQVRSATSPAPVTATADDRQHLWKSIDDLKVAMLTTHDRDETLSGRPVTAQRVEPDGTLWFFVAADGGIATDVSRNARVHLCYMDVGDDLYVWLRGHAAIVDDLVKVKELWSPLAGAWFPGGPEDPNLALLRIKVERGDYWDVDSSKLVQFFSMAKAAITKTPPGDAGTHKKFNN